MTDFSKKSILLGFIMSFFFVISTYSQVVINEICPANISIIQNSNAQYDDWIELHNSSGSTLNLAGYGLTDDTSKLFRFKFPSYSLQSGKKILVFASDSTSEVIADHWEMAVNATSTWRYEVGSASIDTNWRNPSFNQNVWSSGSGGVGFGDSDDGTTVSQCISVMMRKTFNIPDTSQVLKAILMMDYDDGFVAYLNGVEIARSNIGIEGQRPAWNEMARSSHEAAMYQGLAPDSFYISPSLFKSLLRPTNNVLAIETHNTPLNSNDITSLPYLFFGMKSTGLTFSAIPSWFLVPPKDYFNAKFKLSRNGETVFLVNPSGTIIDQKTYPAMSSDNSYCRKPDGSNNWCFVSVPTPDATNNSSTCYSGYANPPVFSVQGGYYNSSKTLTLTNTTPGGSIRYTLNGDEPSTSSRLYTSAFTISSSTSVRAKVFASGYLPSEVVTNTYLINEDTHLPSFSITTDSLNLWDENTGIYTLGPNAGATSPYFGANFWMDWAKPASIEFFDKYKNLVVRFDAEIEIYGNYSRAKPQKSFEVKLSDKFGTGSINYPLYNDKPFVDDINNFILRNSGTDWNVVHFRDALMQRIQKSTFSGYLAAEPAIAFLNGAYWGVYCIYENHDQHWMKNNFGLDKNEIDYLVESGANIEVKYGSDGTFWDLYNYATVQNPSTQTYYDNINARLDLKNYTDYFIAETYYNNGDWIGDWTNNIKWWRPNAPGSKWKYMLYDLDMGLGYNGSSTVNENKIAVARNPAAFSYSSEMFDAILNNPTYKRYFINRYADLINTIYLPSNINNVMKSYRDTMSFDMTQHFAKWGSNATTWANNIAAVTNFANARPAKVRDQIESEFGMTDQVVLTLATSPAGSGRIEISTITPTTYPWSGTYFNGNPVTITAIPNPGYTFDHFRSNVTISSNNFNQSVTYNFTANDQITAYFTGSAVTPKICVSELNYNSDSAYNAGDWIELHNYGSTSINISGWKLSDSKDDHMFVFPTGTVIPANGYLVLIEDSVKFKSQYPNVNNRIGPIGFNFSNSGDQIRLFNYLNTLYLSFYYQDLSPWPVQADGGGYTCELSANTADPNNGTSWFTGCIGGSPGKAYSPLLSIPVTIDGTTTFCVGGSAYLHATYVPGYSYQWKRNGIDISGATDSTYTATSSGSYSVGVTYQGCSIVTPATVITVVTQQPSPVTTSASRCGPGNLLLLASSTDSVFWYDAPTGGNLISIGDTLVTPALTQTTTYYARTGRTCTSPSVATTATVNEIAASPVSSDVTRCGPGTVSLHATDTATIRWYNAASGGGLLETGSNYTTNILNNDTSFFVEAGSVCPSPRIEVMVTVNTTPVPTVTDTSRCGDGTMVLNASSPNPVKWYNSPNGGSSIGTGLSFTTPFLTRTDTFYAEANSGCPSVRVRGIAIVIPVPASPVGVNDTLCAPGSATISATASEQVNWYDAPSGGNLVYLGSVFDTPPISVTTTYYAEAGYQCSSARVPVQAFVGSPPPAPSTTSNSRCGTGSVALSGTSSETIYWYSASTGGTLLGTGSTFNTPSISTTTIYYAEAGTLCHSSRTAAVATINSVPSAPVCSSVTRCGNGSVTLNASSPEQVYWYTSSSGGSPIFTGASFVTPSLTATTTYYLETGNNCRSNRISVQAIIAQSLSAPVATNGSRCGPGTVTISATSTGTISWFSSSSGGTALATGTSFTTPSISSTTTYYAEGYNGCTSPRTPVQAVVNAIPSPPVASDGSNCGTGTVTLSANSPEQIYWYTVSSGGAPVGTGSTYVTPSLSSTTTYYVETGNTCRSSRISVEAAIIPVPSAPVLTGDTTCGSGSLVLTTASPGTITWYTASSGGSPVGSGTSFTTPVISATTTYYAQTKISGCTSVRAGVQAVVVAVPAAPSPANNSRCGMGSLTLTATSSNEIFWYENPSGGIALDSGTSFTTPILSGTTTYYLESHSGSCVSTRVSVQAVIDSIPAPPVVNDVSRCGPGQVTLTASAPQQIYWFDHQSGGSAFATGSTYTTPSLSNSENYYVETGASCRSTRERIRALISSVPNPPQVFDTTHCGDGIAVIRASSPEQVNWFDVSSGGTRLDTGLLFTTPYLTSSTTFYTEAGIGCNSSRVPVHVDLIVPPAAPATADSTRCGAGIVVLHASSPEDIFWYDSLTGGNLLGTGSDYTTPVLNATTAFYVETGNSCRSVRIPVNAIIGGSQVASVSEGSSCGPGVVNLSALDPVPTDTLVWYDDIGGNIVGTGSSFTTPLLLSTTTYYIVAHSACTGPPVAVNAFIYGIPVVDLGADTIDILSGQQITLDAGDEFSSYHWSTGQTTDEIDVNSEGLYSVTVVDSNGCQAGDEVFVRLITAVADKNTSDLIKVFPNPAHDQLTITIPANTFKTLSLNLFSADGKLVLHENIKSTGVSYTKEISLSGISEGVYILETVNSEFSMKRKVVVE